MPRRTSYEVRIAGQFGAVRQLDRFSDELVHRRRLPVHIDLAGVTFMRPLAVVGLVLFLEAMLARGREIHITLPGRPGVLNYLVAIGLPEIMNLLGTWSWPEDFPKEATKGLRPMVKLSRFSTADDVDRLSEQMADVFSSDSLLPTTLGPACHSVFSELADNVLIHADAGGYVLAQRFEYQVGPIIDITIGDLGIGVRKSLWRNAALRASLADDSSALRMAMTDGVTSIVGDRYRGYGLGQVRAELSALGRRLVVRSGTAVGTWKEGRAISIYECGVSKGTLVHAMVPC